MKNAGEPDPESTPVSRDFSVAALRSGSERALTHGAQALVHVWAPLLDLPWSSRSTRLTESMEITGAEYRGFEQDPFPSFLSPEEFERCREARHWLHFVRPIQSHISTRAYVNLFRMSLWIVAPTMTDVPFRFEDNQSGYKKVARILDHFRWVEGYVVRELNDAHLDEIRKLLPALADAYVAGRRLKNALVLTFQACVASEWQTALMCYSAAAECLLNYSEEPGVSRRLAHGYAALLSESVQDYGLNRDLFSTLYRLRAQVVHGHVYDRSVGEENLRTLAMFAEALRRLWRAILASDDLRAVLDGDDEQRRQFFATQTKPAQSAE